MHKRTCKLQTEIIQSRFEPRPSLSVLQFNVKIKVDFSNALRGFGTKKSNIPHLCASVLSPFTS